VALPVGQLFLPLVLAIFWRVDVRLEPSALEWRPMPRQLLAEQPWRETPALVLNSRGTVLVLPDGEYLRVRGLPQPVREVVVRTRRGWLVGPDAEGRLVVRVDGLYMPWPARRIPPQHATAALPTSELIATMWVSLHHAPARAVFALMGVATLFRVVATAIPPVRWWDVLVTVAYMVAVAISWSWFRHFDRLRHTGPWVQADAETTALRTHRNGLADGTIALRLPDGRRFTAHLDRAPLDLFANVAHDRTLWVADNGVVGYPYYPVVAAARLTAQD
jgi:hypothetical protein